MHEKIMIGGAQLGLDYGITNKNCGQTEAHWLSFLSEANDAGLAFVDTAQAYGNSEAVIGKWQKQENKALKVLTKLPPIDADSLSEAELLRAYQDSFKNSLSKLNMEKVDCIMLHRTEHLLRFPDLVSKFFLNLKQDGLIESAGASIQTINELEAVLVSDDVDMIQIPFNFLDHRWDGLIDAIRVKKQKSTFQVVARSVFLQGLLLTDDPKLWRYVKVKEPTAINAWINQTCSAFSMNRLELALNYVIHQDWIDFTVLGMTSVKEMKQILSSIRNTIQIDDMNKRIQQTRLKLPQHILNPAQW